MGSFYFCNGGAGYSELALNPHLQNTTFVFVWSTGHTGTEFLTKALRGDVYRSNGDYCFKGGKVDFEEHPRHRAFVHSGFECSFGAKRMLDVYQQFVLRRLGRAKTTYIHIGHDTIIGVLPELAWLLPRSVYVLRLRRSRHHSAASIMAHAGREPCAMLYAPCPFRSRVLLPVTNATWSHLSKFQRNLWLQDEVECQWQAIRRILLNGHTKEITWSAQIDQGHIDELVAFIRSAGGLPSGRCAFRSPGRVGAKRRRGSRALNASALKADADYQRLMRLDGPAYSMCFGRVEAI